MECELVAQTHSSQPRGERRCLRKAAGGNVDEKATIAPTTITMTTTTSEVKRELYSIEWPARVWVSDGHSVIVTVLRFRIKGQN